MRMSQRHLLIFAYVLIGALVATLWVILDGYLRSRDLQVIAVGALIVGALTGMFTAVVAKLR